MGGRVIGLEMGNFTFIEACSPVEGGDDTEIETFYENMYEAILWSRGKGKQEILMGEFNAHVRGWWSTGTNQNGNRLKVMCKQWDQELLQLDKPTHLHSTGNTFCLDYTVIKRSMLDEIIDYDVNEDCPIDSDHLPTTIKIWDWGVKTNNSKRKRIRLDRLQNPVFLKQYQEELQREIYDKVKGWRPSDDGPKVWRHKYSDTWGSRASTWTGWK
ncbi:unnamed protein product [Blepharisma stoltei]|uniref:Endonuclease/exonuclease/phosphatase domain-containing protein n=1 Tax=Blepharisma stoltei TaxID=1481888 RepID=A0AAU9J7B7_9CILI|nr:unnamed protein product [Blepharisma stoltei]